MAGIKEVAAEVAAETGLTQKAATEAVTAVLNAIKDIAYDGEKVTFRKYGTFRTKVRKACERTNPAKRGEKVFVPERTVLAFKDTE